MGPVSEASSLLHRFELPSASLLGPSRASLTLHGVEPETPPASHHLQAPPGPCPGLSLSLPDPQVSRFTSRFQAA